MLCLDLNLAHIIIRLRLCDTMNIPRHMRLCPFCCSTVGDEKHYFIDCLNTEIKFSRSELFSSPSFSEIDRSYNGMIYILERTLVNLWFGEKVHVCVCACTSVCVCVCVCVRRCVVWMSLTGVWRVLSVEQRTLTSAQHLVLKHQRSDSAQQPVGWMRPSIQW